MKFNGKLVFVSLIILIVAVSIYILLISKQKPQEKTILLTDFFNIQVKTATYPVKVLKENTFIVILHDNMDLPVQNASVSISLFMPHMLCGTYIVKLEQKEPGQYLGQGVPLMVGEWAADAYIQIGEKTIKVEHKFQAMR
jgi:hypothetical protein